MVCEQGIRRFGRSAGLVIVLLAAPLAHAQLTTELSEQAIAVGERVSYVISIDHEEPSDVSVEPPELPGVRVVEGPSVRPVSVLTGSERRRAVEVRFTLEAVTAGRYVLPAISVTVAGQPHLTAERLLEIGERGDRSSVPFLARWTGPERPLHVGEAGVYALEIYNVPEYVYPSSITLDTPGDAIFEEVQGLGTIDRYEVDGVTLYAIPVAVFVVTASQEGDLVLPEARIAGEASAATAPQRRVDVRPLPTQVEQVGAVGTFSYEVDLSPMEILENETTQLTVRVSGVGNLHFLVLPEPEIVGFQVESDETTSSLTPDGRGYSGSIERVFTLRPIEAETRRIVPAPFVSLDPATERVVRDQPDHIVPTVRTINEPPSLEAEGITFEPLRADELAAMERRTWYDDPLAYGWLVPGLFVFVASRIWKRRQTVAVLVVAFGSLLLVDAVSERLPRDAIERGLERYDEGNVPWAIYAFEEASRVAPDSPGINYNLAVLYFTSGDVPRASFAAREAIRLSPFSVRARELLEAIETNEAIERSVPPPHIVHPDAFFVSLAVLVNGFFVGMSVLRSSQRGWTVIAGILVGVLVAGSIGGLVASAIRHEHQVGVIREDVTLRRVPGEEAGGWLPIDRGAAVVVVAHHGDSVLVRNVLGLEGWVDLTDLIWSGSPIGSLVRYRGFAL
ncbi:MAG: BatD family protein [Spirochaetota bacterium]